MESGAKSPVQEWSSSALGMTAGARSPGKQKKSPSSPLEKQNSTASLRDTGVLLTENKVLVAELPRPGSKGG